jgi:hypothetical protein
MGRTVRVMNESEAWTYLAEAWEDAYRARRSDVYIPGEWVWDGLCEAVLCLHMRRQIAQHTYRVMLRALKDEAARVGRKGVFVWPPTVNGARQRAAFCRRMARRAARRTKQEGSEKGGEAHGHAA